MNAAGYFPLIILMFMLLRRRKVKHKFYEMRIKHKKGDKEMQELAKRYIGKDVLFTMVTENTIDGILKEVVDNAAVVEKDGKETIVNLDYVIRLREYPKNKNGKRKEIVLD